MKRRAQQSVTRRSPLLAAGLLLGLAAAAWSQRPGRVRNATLTQVEGSLPPRVEVLLDYTGGTRPASVIVDIRSPRGTGSATTDGDDDLVVVPLTDVLGEAHTIEITTSSRVFGRLRTDRRSFYSSSQEPKARSPKG